jgi:hypothetical protein
LLCRADALHWESSVVEMRLKLDRNCSGSLSTRVKRNPQEDFSGWAAQLQCILKHFARTQICVARAWEIAMKLTLQRRLARAL